MALKPHKYFADQFDDEEVLFLFRKHPVVMRKGILLFGFGMLVPLVIIMILSLIPGRVPSLNAFYITVALSFLAGIILMIPSWIAWYFSLFIVTDQRFIQITQKGMFHRSVVDVGLNQVQMVNYEIAGFQETLMGFGTIMVQTYMGDLVIHDVHHPGKIQKKILHILRDQGIITNSHPLNTKDDNEEETDSEA